MPRFFVSRQDFADNTAWITGMDRDHIAKTLRMRVGDAIELCDMEGLIHYGEIDAIDQTAVTVRLLRQEVCESEPTVDTTVFVAVPKGDKAELIVQKCVELGAKRIVFYLSSRCISRPDEKSTKNKIERYQKIAAEAAKQSERGCIPTVEGILSYREMLSAAAACDVSLFFYERGGKPIKEILSSAAFQTAAIITGPEGGFSLEEVDAAVSEGLLIASLGKRILRCETAPIAGLTAVMYHSNNF